MLKRGHWITHTVGRCSEKEKGTQGSQIMAKKVSSTLQSNVPSAQPSGASFSRKLLLGHHTWAVLRCWDMKASGERDAPHTVSRGQKYALQLRNVKHFFHFWSCLAFHKI